MRVELLDPAAAFRLHVRVMVLDHRDDVIGVVVQQVAVGLRNTGQVTDDDLRQRPGDFTNQIAGALQRQRFDEIAAGLVDARTPSRGSGTVAALTPSSLRICVCTGGFDSPSCS